MGERTEKLKKYRRLIPQLATLVVIACTLTAGVMILFFNSTLGWFAMNRQVDGNGMGVAMKAVAAEASYTVYVYDGKTELVHFTGENRTDDTGKNIDPRVDDLKMAVHDVIFKARNRYTPAIIRIHLSRINEEYRSGGNVSVTLTRDDQDAYELVNGVQALPELSTSVLRFTLAKDSSWYNADAKILYNNIDIALYTQVVINKNYTGVSSDKFTTVTGEGASVSISKSDSITLTIPYSASDISGDGEMDVYLYITYDEELVGRFEHNAGIDTSGTTVGKVSTMQNDIEELVVSFSAQS